jgi:hypothetical protein
MGGKRGEGGGRLRRLGRLGRLRRPRRLRGTKREGKGERRREAKSAVGSRGVRDGQVGGIRWLSPDETEE